VLNTSVSGLTEATLNTVDVTCTEQLSQTALPPDSADDLCEVPEPLCDVLVDRQVSCDGGVTWVDAGFAADTMPPSDPIEICSGLIDGPILVRYFGQNNSTTGVGPAEVFNCVLTDSNGNVLAGPQPIGDLPGGFSGQIFEVTVDQCGQAEGGEPGTATLTCECFEDGSQQFDEDTDRAGFECLAPSFTIEKVCETQDEAGDNDITITLTNTGEVDLVCDVDDPLAGFQQLGVALPVGGPPQVFNTSVSGLTEATLNTVDVTCTEQLSQTALPPDSADDLCEVEQICDIQLDRQVSCDGGITWTDAGPGGDALFDDGVTDLCSTTDSGPVQVRWVAINNSTIGGQTAEVRCTLTDGNPNFAADVAAATMPPSGTAGTIAITDINECSLVEDGEPAGVTATLSCECLDTLGEVYDTDSDDDTAGFECLGCDVDIIKEVDCGDGFVDSCTAPIGAPVAVQYTIENTGDVDLFCTITDSNAEILVGVGGSIVLGSSLTPAEVTVEVDDDQTCTAELQAGEPDTARVDCFCGEDGGPETVFDTDDANIQCVAGELICRTPGFWGTHGGTEKNRSTNITQALLDASFANYGVYPMVCGQVIDDTDVDSQSSALEAICTRPRRFSELQLARQLTALALNCILSGFGPECSGHPDLGALVLDCDSVCQGGPGMHSVTQCISEVDCINNGGSSDGFGGCFFGTCADGSACGGDYSMECADGSSCRAIEDNCHERDLCPAADGDSEFCFQPPGPAGSPKACNAARTSECTVLFGDCMMP
jgi:hypothetical protein